MKYCKDHIEKLINGLLPLLKPITTPQRITVKRTGGELLSIGVDKTEKGQPIVRQQIYNVVETVEVPISHKNKIKKIISAAKSPNDMTTRLGQYLRTYGYPPEQKISQNQTEK